MDVKDEIPFGSQEDALFHQAFDDFESRDAAVAMDMMDVEDAADSQESISESQNGAFHEACEAYEQNAMAAVSAHSSSSTSSSNHLTFPSCSASDAGATTCSITISINSNTEKSASSSHSNPKTRPNMPKKLKLGNTYLTVSNLVSQLWCEQQMVYNFWKPNLDLIFETTPTMPAEHKAAIKKVIAAASGGNKIHEKRDREVNKYVPIVAKTREDKYGIRLVNIIHSLRGLLLRGRPCVREIAIFGMPIGHGILVVGTIDELRFDSLGRFELVEFKTRGDISRPIGGAQMQAYKMQTMVYKQMLDDLAGGRVDGQAVLARLNLDSDRVLNDELLQCVRQQGDARTSITLGELMTKVLEHFRFLWHVQVLTLEFSSRDDGKTVAKETVEFDPDWLRQHLHRCLAFWTEESREL